MKNTFWTCMFLAGIVCQGASSLPAPILRLDFETPELQFCGLKKKLSLPENVIVAGKFGKGVYFQRPSFNSISREAALPSSTKPFVVQGSAEVKGDVLLFNGTDLSIPNFPIRLNAEYINKTILIIASCEVRAAFPGNIRFSLEVNPWELSDKEKESTTAYTRKWIWGEPGHIPLPCRKS